MESTRTRLTYIPACWRSANLIRSGYDETTTANGVPVAATTGEAADAEALERQLIMLGAVRDAIAATTSDLDANNAMTVAWDQVSIAARKAAASVRAMDECTITQGKAAEYRDALAKRRMAWDRLGTGGADALASETDDRDLADLAAVVAENSYWSAVEAHDQGSHTC